MLELVIRAGRWVASMSVELLSWALRAAPVASKADLLVLIVLCDEDRNKGAGAYLSVATIAERARTSNRGAQNSLRKLEAAGVILANPRPGKTTVYRVCPVTPVAHCTPVADCTPQSATERGALSYGDPGSPLHPSRNEPSRAVEAPSLDDRIVRS